MSGQLKCIRVWVRTIGMPIGYNHIDKPINPPIKTKGRKTCSWAPDFLDTFTYYNMFRYLSRKW